MADDQPPERVKTVKWDDPRAAAREARRMSGADFFDAMRRGKLPEPPFGKLLGIDLFDAGDGTFKMSLQPQEVHYNPMGCVHGGILATLLDSVMSAAVHTALPAGRGYLTTEINVRFLRPVFQSTGEIMAEGRLVSCDGDRATAEGTIIDSRHVVHATATATCAVFRTRRHPRTDEGASEDSQGRAEVRTARQSGNSIPRPATDE
jgi:uncharacterized protein (TIGR00369 family)